MMNNKCPNCDCIEQKFTYPDHRPDVPEGLVVYYCKTCKTTYSEYKGEKELIKKGFPKSMIKVNQIMEDLR